MLASPMWRRPKKIDEAALTALQTAFDKAVKTHGARKLLPEKRLIELEYRGRKLKVAVNTVDQEFEYRKGAWIKSQASAVEIQHLPFEQGGWLEEAPAGLVDPKVLQPYSRARTVALAMLQNVPKTLTAHCDVCTKHFQSIAGLDGSFAIELELMKQMQGKEGEVVMQRRVLASIPEIGRPMAYEESLAKLEELQSTGFYQMSSKPAKDVLAGMLALITKLRHGVAPSTLVLQSSAFMKEVPRMHAYPERHKHDWQFQVWVGGLS